MTRSSPSPAPGRRAALAMLGLALAAGHAGAQDARLVQRLDAQTLAAVTLLVDSARAAGLPLEPLIQKALEGDAMGADPARIVVAVKSLHDRLVAARASLGTEASPAELVVAAAALDVGADADALHRLGERRGRRDVTHALIGLTYLLQRGVPAAGSLEIVLAMLDAGLTASDFASLQRLVDRDVQSGAIPQEAARLHSTALIRYGQRGGRSPGSPP